jgi:redox-sensitive bicupin YhaK (pirin superfamily)
MTTLQTLAPHLKDLGGGFMVRRLLPAATGVGRAVRVLRSLRPDRGRRSGREPRRPPASAHRPVDAHHYPFDGAMMHRDHRRGAADRARRRQLMSAGRGIVHSERVPKDLQQSTFRSHGLQLWVALPEADEDSAPSFQHASAASIPQVRLEGATVQVVVGSAFGATSPIATRSPTLALVFDFDAASGKAVELQALASERALYAVDHPFEIDGEKIDEFTMVVVPEGATPKLAAPRGGRVALVGGEPLGHRFISWNFVSSRRERILAAEADWEAQRFARIPGETEFIPLPTRHP